MERVSGMSRNGKGKKSRNKGLEKKKRVTKPAIQKSSNTAVCYTFV